MKGKKLKLCPNPEYKIKDKKVHVWVVATLVIRNSISDTMEAQSCLHSPGELRFGFGERFGCCTWDPGNYFYNYSSELRNSSQNLNLFWGLGTFPHLGETCFIPWDLQLHIQVSEFHLGFFPLPCSSEGKKKPDRQKGWVYLLVYLLVIKGKAINSQRFGISAAHKHVPFFSLISKQTWQEKAIVVCYSWGCHSSLVKPWIAQQFWFLVWSVLAGQSTQGMLN